MNDRSERGALRSLFLWSFVVRAGFGFLAWLVAEVFGVPLIEDASLYSRLGSDLAQSWLSGENPAWFVESMNSGKDAWFMVALLASFYCFTAGYEAVPFAILAQCVITAYTPVLAYRAGRRLGMSQRGGLFAGRLIAFSPAFVFWAGALYKEGVILLALFFIIDHVLRLQAQFRPTSAVYVGVTLLAFFGLRFYIAAILTVTICIGLTFGRRHGADRGAAAAAVRQLLMLIVVGGVLVMLGVGDRLANLTSGGLEESLSAINVSRRDLATNTSGYLPDADVSTVEGAISFFPVGLAYFLAVPLPWHIGSFRQNMTILETLFWIVVVYPLAARGTVRGLRANPSGVMFLVLTAAFICGFYAIFVGNIGTAYRLRVQVWAIFALLAGWGVRQSTTPRPSPASAPGPPGPGARPRELT